MSTLTARSIPDKYRANYSDDRRGPETALELGLSGTSDLVDTYENALAGWFKMENAVAVSSGTAALTVAMAAVGVGSGDEVIMPPSAPLCTAFPIMAAGATPIFADVRQDGFGLELDSLADAVTGKTRAVIDVPMWGYPTEVDVLRKFCDANDLPLILDLAHSHGTTLNGVSLAHYGTLSCFSTHERKPLATGEGGFVLTNNANLSTICRDYSRFGNLNGIDFGMNYKLGALPAGLGLTRLQHLSDQVSHRQANAERLLSKLDNPAIREHTVIDGGQPNYYSLNLRLDMAEPSRFRDHLDNLGIPSDVKRYGCRCLHEFPVLGHLARDTPNARILLDSTTTLPVHPGISEADIDHMASAINSYSES